jgi:hypothetical protein
MKLSPLTRIAFAATLVLGLAAPALADGPVSVYAGPQFISQGTAQNLAGTVQADVAAGYDFGPHTIVPVRARLDLDDGFGNTDNGRVGYFGVGASARLTTPIYAGIGFSFYSVNVHVSPGSTPAFSQGVAAGTTIPSGSSANGAGFGTNIFVGQKIFSLPGIGLAIEGSYKRIPSLDGVNPSAFGIGIRASL